jgi:hypothetical protein
MSKTARQRVSLVALFYGKLQLNLYLKSKKADLADIDAKVNLPDWKNTSTFEPSSL